MSSALEVCCDRSPDLSYDALEGVVEESTKKLRVQLVNLEADHFEKTQKGVVAESTKKLVKLEDDHFEKAQKDGEFVVVSNCKECKSSEKPRVRIPTLTGNRLRDKEALEHFYSSLATKCVKHFHVPKEKEQKNVGDTFWTDFEEHAKEERNRAALFESEDEGEDDYEERNRAALFESEDEGEDEYADEFGTGPFDYMLDEVWR